MGLARGKNRRRGDTAERAQAMKSVASRAGQLFVRALIATVIGVGLFYGGRYGWEWATTSKTFALATVTVEGAKRADKAELARLGGLTAGQNLFLLDLTQSTRAIEQHPWVRTVEVARHFPSSVAVKVEEHVPAAMVSLGELYLLDREGEPFKKLTARDALDVPLVTGISREEYVEDGPAATEAFKKALATAAAYDEAQKDPKERVSEIRIGDDGLTVIALSGTEVRLGEDASSEKLARLSRVRSELRRRGLVADVIHLDNRVRPGWVTVKLSTLPSERRPASN